MSNQNIQTIGTKDARSTTAPRCACDNGPAYAILDVDGVFCCEDCAAACIHEDSDFRAAFVAEMDAKFASARRPQYATACVSTEHGEFPNYFYVEIDAEQWAAIKRQLTNLDDNAKSAAYDRQLSDYYGGDGPLSLGEQCRRSHAVKRGR
jgi:hypothetical protein